jgi:hypothetical protein
VLKRLTYRVAIILILCTTILIVDGSGKHMFGRSIYQFAIILIFHFLCTTVLIVDGSDEHGENAMTLTCSSG